MSNSWYVWQREYNPVLEAQSYLIDTGSTEVSAWLSSHGAERRAGTSYSTLWAVTEPVYVLLCLRWPRLEEDQKWISDADC